MSRESNALHSGAFTIHTDVGILTFQHSRKCYANNLILIILLIILGSL